MDLTVHDSALVVAVKATGPQAKRADQEVLAGLDVVVDQIAALAQDSTMSR